MKKTIAAAILAATLGAGLAAVAAPSPASAQAIYIGPGGVRIYPGDREYGRPQPHWRRSHIDRRDAIHIARRYVSSIRSVDNRRGDWVVVGPSRRGPGWLSVRIDNRSGRVDVDRLRR